MNIFSLILTIFTIIYVFLDIRLFSWISGRLKTGFSLFSILASSFGHLLSLFIFPRQTKPHVFSGIE
jgi:hypothetical protein